MSAVRVIERPFGELTAPHATADLFEANVLTITGEAAGTILRVYQPDEWDRVTVYHDNGYPEFTFSNSCTAVRQLHAATLSHDDPRR